jgi:acyl-coenzyme A thioesterase PaaI-like protein
LTEPVAEQVPNARVRLAAAARDLVDAVLTTPDAGDHDLEVAAAHVERALAHLSPVRGMAFERARSAAEYLPRSPIVGAISPMSPPLVPETVDDAVCARGVLGQPYEGPPGYVHGGWVALAFDELLGMANAAGGHRGAMTARLTVRYRRPTPLHTELEVRAHVHRATGRRVVTHATLHAGGALTAEAEGLFVMIGAERALEYFGERASPPDPPDPLP